jgi:hypothetical protein
MHHSCCATTELAHGPCPLLLQGLKAAGLDGVLLGGNYVAGVALGKCVEYGFEFAEQVSKYVDAAAPAKQKVAA